MKGRRQAFAITGGTHRAEQRGFGPAGGRRLKYIRVIPVEHLVSGKHEMLEWVGRRPANERQVQARRFRFFVRRARRLCSEAQIQNQAHEDEFEDHKQGYGPIPAAFIS
ncbi:MAG: hypothetical protein ABIJ53_08050 [Verrucomicrobiota bacterium]